MNYVYLSLGLRSVGRGSSDDGFLGYVYIDRWSVRREAGRTAETNYTIFLSFRFLELPTPSLVLSQ